MSLTLYEFKYRAGPRWKWKTDRIGFLRKSEASAFAHGLRLGGAREVRYTPVQRMQEGQRTFLSNDADGNERPLYGQGSGLLDTPR